MGIEVLIESILTALSVGSGCGACCGSSTGMLLSTYVMTHVDSAKKSVLAFLTFYAGKILAVGLLCAGCSFIGKNVLSEFAFWQSPWLSRTAYILMIGMGLFFIVRWLLEQKYGHKHCKAASTPAKPVKNRSSLPIFIAGVVFGISPCAPLMLVAGLCMTLPLHYAVITGTVFSIASILSPMLLILLLTGVLTPNMHKELPGMMKWFRLACYIAVVCIFSFDLVQSFV